MKRLLRTLILLLVRVIGSIAAITATSKARRAPIHPPRILLIRPDHLGDLVMTTPILQALKTHVPDAHLTMLVGPWSSEVVARHPAIDQVITCPFPGFQRAPQSALAPYKLLFTTARQLKRENYDLALNLRPDFWWGAALIYLAAIPHRIGYAIAPGTPFLTQALPFPATPEHATQSNLHLASAGLQALHHQPLLEPYTPERYPLYFVPQAEEQAWVAQRLQQAEIAANTPLVVIHAGTGGAVKLWRTEAWATIANQLATNKVLPEPAHIILTGSQSERPMLEQIAQGINYKPLLITDTTVGQIAALLQRAHLVLGVDNGPLHLATAQDTPTVRMFGPTDHHIFGPWGNPERHLVLTSQQRCTTCPAIPCGRLDFRPEELAEHPCVRLISEQQVEQAIQKLLKTIAPSQRYTYNNNQSILHQDEK